MFVYGTMPSTGALLPDHDAKLSRRLGWSAEGSILQGLWGGGGGMLKHLNLILRENVKLSCRGTLKAIYLPDDAAGDKPGERRDISS